MFYNDLYDVLFFFLSVTGKPAAGFCVFLQLLDELCCLSDFTPNCKFHMKVIPYSLQPLHVIDIYE